MMRVARVVSLVVIGLAVWAGRAQAQPAPSAASDSRFYMAFDFGPTFGHKSSGFLGGEVGARVLGPFDVFVEFGQMKNVGTSDLDARAARIANDVGATASASYRINYFDAGLRYVATMPWPVQPYVMVGVGTTGVRASTALAVNGTTVEPESLGVTFGNDLNGTSRKGFVTFGGGVLYPLKDRYFIDGSYRYGRALSNPDEGATDNGINTNRLSIGVGVRF
jgi:opacity protein-like surface antigen